MNAYPNESNYLRTSFSVPVEAPSVDPDEGALILVAYNPAWQKTLLAACTQMLQYAAYEGTDDEKKLAVARATTLMVLLQNDLSEVEAPVWDDDNAEDSELQVPPDSQDWFGYLEGANFVDNLAGWVFVGAVALSFGVDAAIEFATGLRRLRLLFRTGDAGAIVRVLVDGVLSNEVDTYSPDTGLVQVDVFPPEATGFMLRAEDVLPVIDVVNTGTANPLATPVNGLYQMAFIKKRIWEGEVYSTNVRYNPDCDCIQQTADGGSTWVDTPQNDPRHAPQFRYPARTGADRQCDAAANMEKWLRDFIDGAAGILEAAGVAFTVANFALDFVTLLFPGAALFELLIELGATLFSIGGTALDAAFDDTVYDALLCIFFCRADANGQVDAQALLNIMADIDASADINATAAIVLNAILQIQGEVGLSNAGAIGAEVGDCSACNCLPWPRQFDLCGDLDSWSIVCGDLQFDGVHMVNNCEGSPSIVYLRRTIAIPSGSHITRVDWWGTGGTGAGFIFDLYWNGTLVADADTPFAAPASFTSLDLTGTADMLIIIQKSTTGATARIPAIRLYGTGVPPDIGHDEIDPPPCA